MVQAREGSAESVLGFGEERAQYHAYGGHTYADPDGEV